MDEVKLEKCLLLPIHDFRENGSTCITLDQSVSQSVSLSVRQSVTFRQFFSMNHMTH